MSLNFLQVIRFDEEKKKIWSAQSNKQKVGKESSIH